METAELEKVIAELVRRKQDLDIDGPEYAMLQRVLNGLRYKYEGAGGIWESLDEFGWSATPP